MKRKTFSLLLFLIMVLSLMLPSLPVSAKTINQGHITIDKVSALPGDTVIVKFSIEDNPGIMAMTLTINYDSSALTYQKYYKGYLRDYTIADHPENNTIRFVNCESLNYDYNGAFISLEFKVNDTASYDFHEISITYQSGDFCNWDLDRIMPTITAGGVDVGYTGDNCRHSNYSEWQTVAEPGCTTPGAEQRYCTKCGHSDIRDIAAVGHDFSDEWTVDVPATENSPGSMSRHCKKCNEKTEILSFSLEQTEQEKIDNSIGSALPPSEFTAQLVDEQKPKKVESGVTGIEPENNDSTGQDAVVVAPPDDSSGDKTVIDNPEDNSPEISFSDLLEKPFKDIPEIKGFLIIFLFIIIINLKFLTIF